MKLPTSGMLLEDLVKLCQFSKMPLDAGLVIGDDDGSYSTLAGIHINSLLKIASKTRPEKPETNVTSFGISEPEYNFLCELAANFMDRPDPSWVLGRIVGYLRLQDSEQRQNCPEMHKYYAGFMDFFNQLGTSRLVLLNEADPKLAAEVLPDYVKPEHQEAAKKRLETYRQCNWKLINHLAEFWNIVNGEQVMEAKESASVGAKPYEPRIEREPGIIVVKSLVHGMAKDGIDPLEKEIARAFLKSRFSGFETLDETCVDKMLVDVSRKDVLFYLAMENPSILERARIPGRTIKNELEEIIPKIESAKHLLSNFKKERAEDQHVDSEVLHLVCYALQNIVGIRGLDNISYLLNDYGVSRKQLEKIGLNNVPFMNKAVADRGYLISEECRAKVPEIYAFVSQNPFLSVNP